MGKPELVKAPASSLEKKRGFLQGNSKNKKKGGRGKREDTKKGGGKKTRKRKTPSPGYGIRTSRGKNPNVLGAKINRRPKQRGESIGRNVSISQKGENCANTANNSILKKKRKNKNGKRNSRAKHLHRNQRQ